MRRVICHGSSAILDDDEEEQKFFFSEYFVSCDQIQKCFDTKITTNKDVFFDECF